MDLDPNELRQLVKNLAALPLEQREEALVLMEQIDQARKQQQAQDRFIPFVKAMWPGFIEGEHHKRMAEVFERISKGELKRVCISMPPRHTKSEFSSYLFPAWFLGQHPEKKVIQATHTAELSINFGRKVRNLVGGDDYKRVFPGVSLRADSKAAGRWNTNSGGDYYAVGVGGAMAGHGADLLIIDDPHDETEAVLAAYDGSVFDKVYEWYTTGPRQRLQPGGAIVIIHTRWGKRDLIGRVTNAAVQTSSIGEWEIIEFPAILPSGNSLWPQYWPVEELLKIKRDTPPHKWAAQYMQAPTGEEGNLIKREWWKRWEPKQLPACEFKIQSWDTAHRKTTRSDYSVCTTWGIFHDETTDRKALMLIGLHRERMEFPELKKAALEQKKLHDPDTIIIEGKAAGDSLIQELRYMGVPVQSYTPSRGEDKIVRANAVSDLFASGAIWAPHERHVPGVEDLIEEFSDFPNGAHDDMVDASTLALLRYRKGNFIRIASDEDDDHVPDFVADYY